MGVDRKMKKTMYILIMLMLVNTVPSHFSLADQITGDRINLIDDLDESKILEDEIIIKLKSSISTDEIVKKIEKNYPINNVEYLFQNAKGTTLHNILKIKFNDNNNIPSIICAFENNPHVEYIEPNYVCCHHSIIPKSYTDFKNDMETVGTSLIPNDPLFSKQWALHNEGQTGGKVDSDIDAIEAWDLIEGNPEIAIAIIDTGIDMTHPDLMGNIWVNEDEIPDNGLDDDENGYIDDYNGYDFTNEDDTLYPLDHNGHGTVMSGVIAAIANNEIGISGVTWNCKIMPVKVFDANWISNGNSVFDGIKYAADNGAKVICMAFGYATSTSILKDTIDYAYSKGCVLVCSAGNFGNSRKTYPAAYDNVLAVAGTDHSDNRMEGFYEFNGVWVNSSYGDWVDIAAPGEDIYTTSPTYHVTLCDSWGYKLNYDILSGTTLAAPVVAGVAALVFSKNPDYSPLEVSSIIKANCDAYTSEYDLGCGRVNAYNALMEINNEPEKPATLSGPTSGKAGEYYEYSVSTIDLDGDKVFYLFDWGDGTEIEIVGLYESEETCVASHNWSEKGNYEIMVKARDEYGLESDWSDPLEISMPRYKSSISIFEEIQKKLLTLFPFFDSFI